MQQAADVEIKKIAKIEYYKDKMIVPSSLKNLKSELEQRTVEILESEGIKGKKAVKEFLSKKVGTATDDDAVGVDDGFLGVHDTMEEGGSKRSVGVFSLVGGTGSGVVPDVFGNGVVTTKKERLRQQKKLMAKRKKMMDGLTVEDSNVEEDHDGEEAPVLSTSGSDVGDGDGSGGESSGDSDSEVEDDEVSRDMKASKKLIKEAKRAEEKILAMDSTRKTRAQRNREMRTKLEEEERKAAKLLRQRMNEVYRLKTLHKTIENEKALQKAELEQKKAREAYVRANFPKRLGKLKFEAENIEVKIPEEMRGTLRELVPEGNMFEHRFKAFQRRNIIEPRAPAKVTQRYKRKEYVKHSYKNHVAL